MGDYKSINLEMVLILFLGMGRGRERSFFREVIDVIY